MLKLLRATFELYGDCSQSLNGDIFINGVLATSEQLSEIKIKALEIENEYNSLQWIRDRKKAYLELNQDELRFDDLMNGTTTWQDAILAIKAKYPKPE